MDSYDSSFLFPAKLIVGLRGLKKGRTQRASVLRLIQIHLTTPRFEKGRVLLSRQSAANTNRDSS